MDNPFLWFLTAIFVWMLYMMTFKTKEFLELMKGDRERRDANAERMGKATKGLAGIVRWFFKK